MLEQSTNHSDYVGDDIWHVELLHYNLTYRLSVNYTSIASNLRFSHRALSVDFSMFIRKFLKISVILFCLLSR